MTKKWAAVLALATAVIVPGVIGTSVGQAAASVCTTKYCGGVVTNNSSRSIFVSNNWCWGGSGTTYYGSVLPCATSWNDHAYNSYFYLAPGSTTANYYYYYDTDAFRVDAGCQVDVYDGFENLVFSDRGNTTPMWVKINSLQRYSVTAIIC